MNIPFTFTVSFNFGNKAMEHVILDIQMYNVGNITKRMSTDCCIYHILSENQNEQLILCAMITSNQNDDISVSIKTESHLHLRLPLLNMTLL